MTTEVALYLVLLVGAGVIQWLALRLATKLLRGSRPLADYDDARGLARGFGRSLLNLGVIVAVYILAILLAVIVATSADPWASDVEIWPPVVLVTAITTLWLVRHLLARQKVMLEVVEKLKVAEQQLPEETERVRRLLFRLVALGLLLWVTAATVLFVTDDRLPLIFVFPTLGLLGMWVINKRHPRVAAPGCLINAFLASGLWPWGMPATVLFVIAAVIAFRTPGVSEEPGAKRSP